MSSSLLFFFNDTPTTEIYTLSLHDALPISAKLANPNFLAKARAEVVEDQREREAEATRDRDRLRTAFRRSEEHTSELQSRQYLVCRLLLEKKKEKIKQQSKTKS